MSLSPLNQGLYVAWYTSTVRHMRKEIIRRTVYLLSDLLILLMMNKNN